jgi:hypothetical protein
MRAGGAVSEPATTRERLLVPELTTTILDEEHV